MSHPVRPARRGDRPAVERLQSRLREPAPALLEYGFGPGRLLVTPDSEGAPGGYLLAVPAAGVHVAELVVDPARRREGRATALLSAVLDGGGRVTVAVAPDNGPALALYESLGFRWERRLPELFADGPALLLVHGGS